GFPSGAGGAPGFRLGGGRTPRRAHHLVRHVDQRGGVAQASARPPRPEGLSVPRDRGSIAAFSTRRRTPGPSRGSGSRRRLSRFRRSARNSPRSSGANGGFPRALPCSALIESTIVKDLAQAVNRPQLVKRGE